MRTLLLDQINWDLVLDRSNNIAVASGPYALAQDAASSIKTFEGEVYYDTVRGVPYFAQILGQFPSIALMKARFTAAALLVPGVVKARCFIFSFSNRVVRGQVQTEDASGARSFVGF